MCIYRNELENSLTFELNRKLAASYINLNDKHKSLPTHLIHNGMENPSDRESENRFQII